MRRIAADSCPLTGMQTAMVLATMRDPRSGVYVVQDMCETPERLDLGQLQHAWRAVADRHPALRTAIETGPDGPMTQAPAGTPDIPWNELDWTPVPVADLQDKLAGLLRADRECGFDFAQGVPMRMTLLRVPGGASILIWTSHHVLLDGQSYLTVWREWFAAYDGEAGASSPGASTEQPVSFAEYVDWLERQNVSDSEQFWRKHLAHVSRTTGFIVDRLRSGASPASADMARENFSFSAEATAGIRDFARRHDLTVGTLVQCAWALLLSRYGGAQDVVFGVTRSGRRTGAPGAASIVGPLINTLPFRIDADPSARVVPWMREVRNQMLAMRQHEHTPMGRIRDWNILPSGSGPFDTLFIYEPERPGETLSKLGGNWSHRRVTRRQRTDTPLTLTAAGRPNLTLDLVYDTRLFCRETVVGIAGHLRTLIESFIAQPDSRLAELTLLTQRERLQIEERNQPAVAGIAGVCAHQLFERQVERSPAAVALDHTGGSVSFEQLNRRGNQLAGLLREQGAGPGDVVGVCLSRSPDAAAAVLAVLKAGAAFAPLPPDLPAARIHGMLEDVRPKLVVATANYAHILGEGGCPVLCLDRLEAEIARQSETNLDCIATPDHAAFAVFTSGSTGRPRAALITHRSLANQTQAVSILYGVAPTDRRLQFASLGSDMFVSEIFTFLCSGAALVFCLDPAGNSIAEFLHLIDRHRITITGMPASWWGAWVSGIESGDLGVPPNLRIVIAGMERLNPAALVAFRRAGGSGLKFFNVYGPSEAAPIATAYEAGSSRWESASLVPIGRPIANIRMYVLDGHGNPVPAGVPGELYIAGAGVGYGYLNAPELTAAKFLPDPFSADPTARMFRTGDSVFSLPDGNLVFLGRVDRQVKIRGFRVELEEIEAVLAEHPGVRQCAVIAQESGGSQRLAAFLTAAGDPPPSTEDLRLHLLRRLPSYMVPTHFATLPKMPMTANGKIDRRALPLGAVAVRACDDFLEPATLAEKRLAALWQELLGVPRVSATANFFESGGDSLRATQLVVRIQREFGKAFPFALFLRAPTIAQIARVLDCGETARPGLEMAQAATLSYAHQGTRIPLFCITSHTDDLYVFRHVTNHLDSEQPVFVLNVPVLEGEVAPTVEELAGRVCQSIRGMGAQGPYILGGYCFGGVVAFEAAHQLIANGAQVPLVALFDTPAPGYPRLLGSRQMASGVRAVGRFVKGSPAAPVTDAAEMARAAVSNYDPKPIDAAVAQFMASDQVVSSRLLEDPRLAWRELCKGFRVYRVPGDHVTWLQEPHAQAVAAQLTAALLGHARAMAAVSR